MVPYEQYYLKEEGILFNLFRRPVQLQQSTLIELVMGEEVRNLGYLFVGRPYRGRIVLRELVNSRILLLVRALLGRRLLKMREQ
jgi:hypothetical protein